MAVLDVKKAIEKIRPLELFLSVIKRFIVRFLMVDNYPPEESLFGYLNDSSDTNKIWPHNTFPENTDITREYPEIKLAHVFKLYKKIEETIKVSLRKRLQLHKPRYPLPSQKPNKLLKNGRFLN